MSKYSGARDVQWVWGGLLIVATIVLSSRFACAVPFAALAALAAVSADRKTGSLLIVAIWLTNQAIGFAFLNYPLEFQCVGWGLMLGISALLSLLAGRAANSLLEDFNTFVRAGAAFLFAFFAYEGSLYAASVVTASSETAFTGPIIKEVAAINGGSFAVLFCAYRALLAADLIRRSLVPMAGTGFRAAKPQTA